MTVAEIINARRGAAQLGSLQRQDRIDAFDGMIKRLYALKGYESDAAEVSEIVAGIFEKVSSRYQALTVGEIYLAWEAGVCGEYGTDRRISMANLLAWLGTYTAGEIRRAAIEQIVRDNRKQDASRLLPMDDLKRRNEEANRRAALEQWEIYKRDGQLAPWLLNGMAASICDYLKEAGKMKPTAETESAAREMAGGSERGYKRQLLALYFEALRKRETELRL